MGWRHTSGFSVHNGVRIARDDENAKEGIAQYIIRNPFSEKKLTYKEKKEQAKEFDTTATPEVVEVIDVSSYKPRRIPSKTWRDCIKKIWEVDPLECPKCHAEMKIISFISKAQPEVIRKILEHLDLWEERIRPPPNPPSFPPHEEAITDEPFDDGWPGYEEPFITVS